MVAHEVWGAALSPGWTSLIMSVIAFGSMNLVCLGLMGEYVGRIYDEIKKRPLYIVDSTLGGKHGSQPQATPGNQPGHWRDSQAA